MAAALALPALSHAQNPATQTARVLVNVTESIVADLQATTTETGEIKPAIAQYNEPRVGFRIKAEAPQQAWASVMVTADATPKVSVPSTKTIYFWDRRI